MIAISSSIPLSFGMGRQAALLLMAAGASTDDVDEMLAARFGLGHNDHNNWVIPTTIIILF